MDFSRQGEGANDMKMTHGEIANTLRLSCVL
jgi:hypothetical protein